MGGGGGHGPRAQALEGAPAQLVGANFKKKIRPRQISKVTSLQCAGVVAKVAYVMGICYAMLYFFFCLSIFSPGADAGFTKRGEGAPMQALAPRALETLTHWVKAMSP